MSQENISPTLYDLLLQRHSNDLCVGECKTGSTLAGRGFGFRQFDLWVMKKSWTNFRTYGYEIKASRSDFLRDEKWPNYLKYCHEFYFVAPKGLIMPEELPAEVGLLVGSKNLGRLHTQRKAVFRNISIPPSIYIYILMWRTKIVADSSGDKEFMWRNWLSDKKGKQNVGWEVGRKISRLVQQNVSKIVEENKRLREENDALEEIKHIVKKLGFDLADLGSWNTRNKIHSRLRELDKGYSEGLFESISSTILNLKQLKEKLGDS